MTPAIPRWTAASNRRSSGLDPGCARRRARPAAGSPLGDVQAAAGRDRAGGQLLDHGGRDEVAAADLDAREAALPQVAVEGRLVEPQLLGRPPGR